MSVFVVLKIEDWTAVNKWANVSKGGEAFNEVSGWHNALGMVGLVFIGQWIHIVSTLRHIFQEENP